MIIGFFTKSLRNLLLLTVFGPTLGMCLMEDANAIIGGDKVTPRGFAANSAVLIYVPKLLDFGDSGASLCSGALIAPDLVLTAGHCVTNSRMKKNAQGEDVPENLGVVSGDGVFVVAGLSHDLSKGLNGNDMLKVGSVVGHPGFLQIDSQGHSSGHVHDIALLKLSRPAGAPLLPARPMLDPTAIVADTAVTIAGFGVTTAPPSDGLSDVGTLYSFPTLVAKTLDPIPGYTTQLQLYQSQNLPRFKEDYASGSDAERNQIESYGEASGDSGGPAYLLIRGEPFVAGISSGFDDDGFPTYENVSQDAEWLREAAQNAGSNLK